MNRKGERLVGHRTFIPRVGLRRFFEDRDRYLVTRAVLGARHFELANGHVPPDIATAWPEATPDQLSRITYDPVRRRAMAGKALAEF